MMTPLVQLCFELTKNIHRLPLVVSESYGDETAVLQMRFAGKAVGECDWSLFSKDPELVPFVTPSAQAFIFPCVIVFSGSPSELLWRIDSATGQHATQASKDVFESLFYPGAWEEFRDLLIAEVDSYDGGLGRLTDEEFQELMWQSMEEG